MQHNKEKLMKRNIWKRKKLKRELLKHLKPTVLLIVFLVSTASAEQFIITDTVEMNLDNGAYITLLPGQAGINLSTFNNTDIPASTLSINITGSQILANTDANISLNNISYSQSNDLLSYDVNGVANLNMTASMGTANTQYQVLRQLINNGTVTSGNTKFVTVIRSITGELNFIIKKLITPTTGKPTITFIDSTCLGGMICTSTVYVYQGNTKIGSINSTGSYIALDQGINNINISLEESTLGQLNNPDETRNMMGKTWAELTMILMGFGILVTI